MAPASTLVVATERRKCDANLLGANAAAGRFLVFKEGTIKTDYGLSVMNPKAGADVIKKFRERGNDMMIDLRHFSISPTATAEQSAALGWIPCPNGLEYVNGEGLYATGVQWTPEVKAGLECSPPKWKYFSPYYDQDKKTKVITELLNVALTNMPATHGLNRLAAERSGAGMDLVLMGKALMKAMALAESGDQAAIEARDAIIAALGDQADAAIDAAQKADAGVEETAAEEDVAAGMGEDEKKAYEALPDGMKATYAAGIKAAKACAASDDKASVAAESDKKDEKEPVAAGIDAQALLLMARGAESETRGSRERIVAEHAHLIPPAMKSIVMDPKKVSDKALAEFIAARKSETKTVTVTAGRTVLPGKKPESRPAEKVPETIAAEASRIAKKTGTDPKKVLAELLDQQKAARAQA